MIHNHEHEEIQWVVHMFSWNMMKPEDTILSGCRFQPFSFDVGMIWEVHSSPVSLCIDGALEEFIALEWLNGQLRPLDLQRSPRRCKRLTAAPSGGASPWTSVVQSGRLWCPWNLGHDWDTTGTGAPEQHNLGHPGMIITTQGSITGWPFYTKAKLGCFQTENP